jgi:hypothetical protein
VNGLGRVAGGPARTGSVGLYGPLMLDMTFADHADRHCHPEITIAWTDYAYAGQLVTWAERNLGLT